MACALALARRNGCLGLGLRCRGDYTHRRRWGASRGVAGRMSQPIYNANFHEKRVGSVQIETRRLSLVLFEARTGKWSIRT
jgi:hypothetical protein